MKKMMTRTPTLKCLWMVLMVMLLMASMQADIVHCRTLRSTGGKDGEINTATGCEGVVLHGINSITGLLLAPFSASSESSSSSNIGGGGLNSVRNLAFKLASGPSRKGPGH